MSHECPAPGCVREVPTSMLTCRPHWYSIPLALRSAIWRAWARGEGAGSIEHFEAIQDAVNYLQEAGHGEAR